jgi:hypothetical protein
MKIQNSKLEIRNCSSKFKTFYFLIVLFTFNFLLLTFPAHAQELSVGIDPPIIQINTDAPSDILAPITISNLSDTTTSYSIFLMPFTPAESNDGAIEIDRALLGQYERIFSNIRILDEERPITSVTLSPDEKKDLNLRVVFGKDEPPKDYYFTVLFVSEEESGSPSASVTGNKGGIGSNILLSVGPKSETKGIITDFSGPKFVTSGPVEFALNVFNNSSHFVEIEGSVVVKNMFGHTIGNVNILPVNILSASGRLMESENNSNILPRIVFPEKFLVGYYTAEATIALSEDGPILKEEFTFFAFPVEFLLGLGGVSIIVIFIIRRAKRLKDTT